MKLFYLNHNLMIRLKKALLIFIMSFLAVFISHIIIEFSRNLISGYNFSNVLSDTIIFIPGFLKVSFVLSYFYFIRDFVSSSTKYSIYSFDDLLRSNKKYVYFIIGFMALFLFMFSPFFDLIFNNTSSYPESLIRLYALKYFFSIALIVIGSLMLSAAVFFDKRKGILDMETTFTLFAILYAWLFSFHLYQQQTMFLIPVVFFILVILTNRILKKARGLGPGNMTNIMWWDVKDFQNSQMEVNSIDKKGNSPLVSAITYHNMELVEYLVENGADILFQNKDGDSLLHIACRHHSENCARYLIEKGVDINLINDSGKSFLSNISFCNKEFIDYVFGLEISELINRKDKYGFTPLHSYLFWNKIDLIKLAIENGADVNLGAESRARPIETAIRNNRYDIVKLLFDSGADLPNGQEAQSSIAFSIKKDTSVDIVELLIKNGLNPKLRYQNGHNILTPLTQINRLDLIKIFIANGADLHHINDVGENLIFTAVYWKSKEVLEYLLIEGLDRNLCNKAGRSPIDLAKDTNMEDEIIIYMLGNY